MQTKACNTYTLCELADAARKHDYNRQLGMDFLADVDPEGTHILTLSLVHSDQDPHIRTFWYVKMKGSTEPREVSLDIPIEDFDTLPTIDNETP